MTINVKLFAILRERAGTSQLSLELRDGATVAAAAEALGERVPRVRPYLARVAWAVNRDYVSADAPLHDGDELAAIPPVSGG